MQHNETNYYSKKIRKGIFNTQTLKAIDILNKFVFKIPGIISAQTKLQKKNGRLPCTKFFLLIFPCADNG